jgi:TRAP-type C4-dicarboxylate transport system permease small subunit
MLQTYERLLDGISALVKWAMLAMASVIFVVICATVFTRYLLNLVPSWSEEVPRYMLVWITYLGAALCVHYQEHISLDIFFRLLPVRLQRLGQLVLNLMVGAVGGIMVVYGIGLMRHFGEDLMESIPVTNFWLYLAMPVSGVLIILYVLLEVWRGILGLNAPETHAVSDVTAY